MVQSLQNPSSADGKAPGRKPRDRRAVALRYAIFLARKLADARQVGAAESRAGYLMDDFEFLLDEGLVTPKTLADGSTGLSRRIAALSRSAPHDRDAWVMLASMAGLLLQKDLPLPPAMRDFVIDVLERRCPCPPTRGRPPTSQTWRNVICLIVANLVEQFRLPATRNDASEHRMSACDIVAEAFGSLGLKPSSYASLKRIWQQRDPDICPRPGRR